MGWTAMKTCGLVLFFTMTVLPVAGQGPMTNTTTATGSSGSNSVVKLDCNGDNIPDLVTTNPAGSFSVFVGNGDGTYQSPVTLSLPSGAIPRSLATADINGDNKADLVIAANSPNAIYPVIGNGSCGFAVQTAITTGVGSPYWVALADVNGDKKFDIVASDLASAVIRVFLGDGMGGFGAAISSTVGTFPWVFTVADLNGDGILDIVAADYSNSGIQVAVGDGTGKFNSPAFFSTGNNPQVPAIGDINGDGKADLAVANGGSDTVHIFLGTYSTVGGTPTFAPPFVIHLPSGTAPGNPALTTTPGGDKQDLLVVPDFVSNGVTVFPGLAPQVFISGLLGTTFSPTPTTYPVGLDPSTAIAVPGPGIAAPGASGLNLLLPNCPVSVSPTPTIYFGPNPPALIPGLEVEVTVPAGCPWTSAVTFNGSTVNFATVTPSSGVGPATVLVQMTPNSGASRGARVTFTSGANSAFTFAYQSAGSSTCPYGSVDKTSISAGSAGGTGQVNITLPVTSDGCNSAASSSNPAVGVNPTSIAGSSSPTPITFTIPSNPGDTTNYYGLIGPYLININSTGACVPVIGPFNGTVPSGGTSFTIPVTIPSGCSITPKAAGLGATASATATGTGFNVTVTVPATTATYPLTGTVTIGDQVAHFVQNPPSPTQPFTDVPLTSPYADWITMLRTLGITAGCGPSTYCPDDPVTRAQMAVFVVRSIESGDNFPYTTTPYFTDVPANNIYFKWIQRLKDLGITAGCTATSYCLNDPVTRGQMAVFLIRGRLGAVAGPPIAFPGDQYFSDEPSSDGFYPYIQRMKALGVTAGCTATNYCPGDSITRAQMAVFLIRNFFTPYSN